ncbi:hypothetical protein [Methylobacterium nonmethylotrophicum]|uniref:Uncharacterized protein n=1 Tax=Methylobacterium nonmethylotrophicum TaxID=1141884 RepID=A0A4Z0NR75_9HYPH|nr:hypothetical protein [Methylobacterium nonmethylotrophicum]TGD98918.1 hypothetical protein EU555_13465 [Methylobacterium nonmethylotrophicum]
MATQPSSVVFETTTHDPATVTVANGAATPAPMLIVDLGKRQSKDKIKKLRKGRGSLVPRIEKVVRELVASGAVAADAQPVVIVVREETPPLWPFS